MKQCIIIAGPNGAGKTTFAGEFLPREGQTMNFLNADLIAAGLSPYAPEKAALEAGMLLLKRIETLCQRGESFGLESTLSGTSLLSRIAEWKSLRYYVTLHFLRLSSPEMAIERVHRRVAMGGHSIPDDVVRRRFARGLANLPAYKRAVDKWRLWDTSRGGSECIDEG